MYHTIPLFSPFLTERRRKTGRDILGMASTAKTSGRAFNPPPEWKGVFRRDSGLQVRLLLGALRWSWALRQPVCGERQSSREQGQSFRDHTAGPRLSWGPARGGPNIIRFLPRQPRWLWCVRESPPGLLQSPPSSDPARLPPRQHTKRGTLSVIFFRRQLLINIVNYNKYRQ